MDYFWRKSVIKNLNNNPKTILDIATGTADIAISASKIKNAKMKYSQNTCTHKSTLTTRNTHARHIHYINPADTVSLVLTAKRKLALGHVA